MSHPLTQHCQNSSRRRTQYHQRDKTEVAADAAPGAALEALLARPRPAWSRVRWILVQGLEWQSVAALARAFDLHPLAVEDCMHVPQRVKADFYADQLFISFARFLIRAPSAIAAPPAPVAGRARWRAGGGSGEQQQHEQQQQQQQHEQQQRHPSRTVSMRSHEPPSPHPSLGGAGWPPPPPPGPASPPPQHHQQQHQQRRGWWRAGSSGAATGAAGAAAAAAVTPMELAVEQVSLFLLKGGTIITVFQGGAAAVCRPVVERLQGLNTLLTDSEDASFLANVILDRVVDETFPAVALYARRVAALEARVLTEARPRAEYTKELHLLANDCSGARAWLRWRRSAALPPLLRLPPHCCCCLDAPRRALRWQHPHLASCAHSSHNPPPTYKTLGATCAAVLRRALVPAQQLIHKLQSSAAARGSAAATAAAAAAAAAAAPHACDDGATGGVAQQQQSQQQQQQSQQQQPQPWQPLSPLTCVYLSDVLDHVDTVRCSPSCCCLFCVIGPFDWWSRFVPLSPPPQPRAALRFAINKPPPSTICRHAPTTSLLCI